MSLISTWSTVANANGTLGTTPNYWPEGQAPSTVNDCARLMMASIRTQWNDAAWFNWGYTVTRVSGNSFTVVTASWNTVTLPAAFEANARIKLLDTTTMYGTITTVSSSAASTLVTFTPDSGSLTASFSSVFNSIISPTNTAIPGLTLPTDIVTQKTQQLYAVDTGATNSVQLSMSPVIISYTSGEMINFKAAQTNTGPTGMQVDAIGIKSIKKEGGTTDLEAGDILAGQIVGVIYDGTNFQMQSNYAGTTGGGGGGGGAGGLMSVQVFTSSGTWNKPVGVNKVVVEVVGAGGAGGGSSGAGSGEGSAGGGGAGGYAEGILDVSAITSETITIGTGGTPVVGLDGNPGTSSSFGAHFSASGGGGGEKGDRISGNAAPGGGAGGIGTGGSINIDGGSGSYGRVTDGILSPDGLGGSSQRGPGGVGGFVGTGFDGDNYGGGGGGATTNSASSYAGGAGADGIVIVWEYS